MDQVVAEGLDRVVETLCRRGIEAGEREASARIAQADAEAEQRRAAAEADAQQIIETARQQAEREREQLALDLAQATRAGVVAFRRAVEAAVLLPAVQQAVDAALGEPTVLGDLLVEAVRAFGRGDQAQPLTVCLPASTARPLVDALMARARAVARRGVELRLDPGIEGGFLLVDDRVELSFSDAAFTEVLLELLTHRVRERVRELEASR